MNDGSRDTGVRAIAPGQHILGLDLGTNLGFAVLDHDGRLLSSGCWHMPTSKAHPGKRWHDLGLKLDQLLWPKEIALLAYEDVHRHAAAGRPNYRAAQVYGGIQSATLLAAFRLSRLDNVRLARVVPCVGVPLTTVKMRATGGGAAKKDAMRAAAAWRWGREFESEDEADAAWIAWSGLLGDGHAPGAGHARGGRCRSGAIPGPEET